MEAIRRTLSCGLLVCLFFACGTDFSAQTANATLSGTVSDTARALMPGVSITAVHTQTGVVSSALSNETGTYNFASLQGWSTATPSPE